MGSIRRSAFASTCLLTLSAFVPGVLAAEESVREEQPVEIIQGEDRTIYEYRQNGVLRIIKVVPKEGRPYYLVPANGEANFDGLERVKHLYPQWVIVEW